MKVLSDIGSGVTRSYLYGDSNNGNQDRNDGKRFAKGHRIPYQVESSNKSE
jgi:hypothetical protein